MSFVQVDLPFWLSKAHEDGPLYHPVVAIISLGSHCGLDFYSKSAKDTEEEEAVPIEERRLFTVLTQPRSLLIFSDDAYKAHLHGIRDLECDVVDATTANSRFLDESALAGKITRGLRYSLTIRIVPKVMKPNLFRLK